MIKRYKESHAGWGDPHPNDLTPQRDGQLAEARCSGHIEQRPFAPGRRCNALKGNTLSAALRLALTQNPAAHCGKMIEYGP